MSNPSGVKLFYHFSFQDIPVLTEHTTEFHGLVVNANTVAYASYRVKQFLHDIGRPFIVDPMTYVFASSLDAVRNQDEDTKKLEDLKLSYRNLATKYGGPFLECLNLTPVYPPRFLRSAKSTEAVRNIIAFQRGLPGSEKSLIRYRRYQKKRQIAEELRPVFLLGPYFYFKSVQDPWYRVSLGLSMAARSFRGDLALFAVICPSQYSLESVDDRKQIVKDYVKFDGLMIWVPGMKDDKSPLTLLRSVTELVHAFSVYGKPVILLRAGYYGALLAKAGLAGFSSGLCYGESKSLNAGGGRFPIPTKYYIPQVHLLRPNDIAAAFYNSDRNAPLLCHCPVCLLVRRRIGHIESQKETPELIDRFFHALSLEEAQSHLLICRAKEANQLDKENKSDTLLRLKAEEAFVATDMNPPPETTLSNHFARWITALS